MWYDYRKAAAGSNAVDRTAAQPLTCTGRLRTWAMRTLIMNVNGMTCDNCVEHVQSSLNLIPGVIAVEVDLMARQARVIHDETACKPADLVAGVQRVGFQVDGFELAEPQPEPAGEKA